jgi:hypothetical protein
MRTKIRTLLLDPRAQLMLAGLLSGMLAIAIRKLIPDARVLVTRATIVVVPLLFFAACAYWVMLWGAVERLSTSRRIVWAERLLALAVPLIVHFADPPMWLDDAGFILRYFAQAQEGCFYCFNASDGPVFGISSFLFGALGNALAWTGLLSPEQCLLVLTYAGLYLATLAMHGLLRHVIRLPLALPVAFLTVLTLNKSFWVAGNGGMEAPLHLAICLFALQAFVQARHLRMWFMLALAVISKLDAVPLVLAVGGLWAIRERRHALPLSTRNPHWRALVLGGLAPVLLYIGVAILLFGSPLPQSAYVKAFLQTHPDDSFFPFLSYFILNPLRLATLCAALLLFIAYQLVLWVRRDADWTTQTAAGWAFVAVMGLYYLYNPAEQMVWYYVLPETLLLIQSVVAFAGLSKLLPTRLAFPVYLAGTALAAVALLTYTYYTVNWFRRYERWVEVERSAIGHAIAERTQPGDTLMAGHGLLSAYTSAYVIDITGLNSKLATDYDRDYIRMIEALRPDWIVLHGWGSLFGTLSSLPYEADTAHYDVTLHRYAAWRVWRKVPEGQLRHHWERVQGEAISGDRLRNEPGLDYHRLFAHSLRFDWKALPAEAGSMDLGVYRRKQPFVLQLRQFAGDSLLEARELTVAATPAVMGPPYFSQNLRIPLRALPGRPFRLEISAPDTATFEVVDPMLRLERK